MKKLAKNLVLSFWIAVLGEVFDQIYHIGLNQSHQIFEVFNNYYTFWYVALKFAFIFITAMIVLSSKIKSIWTKSIVIGVVSAFLFGMLLSYFFPYVYTLGLHMFHAIAMFLAAIIVLYVKKR